MGRSLLDWLAPRRRRRAAATPGEPPVGGSAGRRERVGDAARRRARCAGLDELGEVVLADAGPGSGGRNVDGAECAAVDEAVDGVALDSQSSATPSTASSTAAHSA